MDSYRPDSDTVRVSCLADVDTCDLYVLILGHRYGFQPLQDNPEDLSITHLEYGRAGQAGIPRIVLLRTSIPDVTLSDMEDPDRWARVRAFREEVVREVRAAEFSDLQGLIQGLSTGVLAELAEQSAAAMGVARALRLASPPALLAGREDLLADLDDRLAGGGGWAADGGAVRAGGCGEDLAGAGVRSAAPGGGGIAWQFPAEDPAVLAAGFTELADPAGGPGAGTRWRRCTRSWPSRRGGCWCSTMRPTRTRWRGFCRRWGTGGC